MATNQQFNLRWNNHTSNILQVFVEQLSNESLVDVTLSCQGQFLKAHKMVLSACSPYFQELFRLHDDKHQVIILNGIRFEDIRMVIDFMYRGEVKVQENDLETLLAVAETLQVKGLANVRNKYEKGEIHGKQVPANADSLPSTACSSETHHSPSSNKSVPPSETPGEPVKQASKRKRTSDQTKERNAMEKPAKRPTPKSPKNVNDPTPTSPSKSVDSQALPCVQVTMNDCSDDDLSSTIKVEPLYIKDIDDEDSSWDPSNLVIDMQSEEQLKPSTTPVVKSGKVMFKTKAQLVKVRPASELISPPSSSASPTQSPSLSNTQVINDSNSSNTTSTSTDTSTSLNDSTCNAAKDADNDTPIASKERRGSKRGRIPRPPNAFMIFANEWRRKIAKENPCESNKDISVRLGIKWKSMSAEKKEIYYTASRLADEEHKKKYPNYYYSPMEARLRKSQAQALRQKMLRGPSSCIDPNLENSDAVRYVKIFMKEEKMETGEEENKQQPVFLTTVGPDGNLEIKTEIPECDEPGHNLEEEFLKLVELRRISPTDAEMKSGENVIAEGEDEDCTVTYS